MNGNFPMTKRKWKFFFTVSFVKKLKHLKEHASRCSSKHRLFRRLSKPIKVKNRKRLLTAEKSTRNVIKFPAEEQKIFESFLCCGVSNPPSTDSFNHIILPSLSKFMLQKYSFGVAFGLNWEEKKVVNPDGICCVKTPRRMSNFIDIHRY